MTTAATAQAISREEFKHSAEADLDGRRRVSLGKVGRPEHTRYEILENDMGEILLVPLVSIPAREAIIWENPELRASLVRGMEQAAHDKLVDRGDFTQYINDDEN